MKRLLNYRFLMMLVVILMLTTGTTAYAAIINVPGDQPTISAAISAANLAGGDTIKVAKGKYLDTSQVVIDRDVTIRGKGAHKTIITKKFDTSNIGDLRGWWWVKEGKVLHLSRVTMDGSDGNKPDDTSYLTYQGIRHEGTGTIKHCKFTDIKYYESGPDYAGTAVAAFGGPVDITRCKFTHIGVTGVLYSGPGVFGSNFNRNVYRGKGYGEHLDYAVDVEDGAQVTIYRNRISRNRGSVDGSISAGILVTTLFGAGTTATIIKNLIYKNSTGIFVGFDDEDTSVVDVRKNMIFDNGLNGIDIFSIGPGSKVMKNRVWRNGDNGILLDGINNYEVNNNKVLKNKGHGISIIGSVNDEFENRISKNWAWGNALSGFNADMYSFDNEFNNNKSFRNKEFGYVDDSTGSGTGGTANTYVNNKCWKNVLGGSNPSGLCGPQP